MSTFLKYNKLQAIFPKIILFIGLLVPLLLFLNRFLSPDSSFDSINYHLFVAYRAFHPKMLEFFPTGIHNFSPLLDIPNYLLIQILGYRTGTIGSLLCLYLILYFFTLIYKLYYPNKTILSNWWKVFLLVNSIITFEIFLQIATLFTDIQICLLMVITFYYLLKFQKFSETKYLIFSSIALSVMFLGKMTSWFFAVPYYFYLIYSLQTNNKIDLKKKILLFLTSLIISSLLVIPWLTNNYFLTSNPVFPFYNAIFKSDYFPHTNFAQIIFGGKTLIEKVFWGFYSILTPVRLGEVHDLFTDYKINFYFITSIIIFVLSLVNRRKQIAEFSAFYLLTFLSWSLVFGYLRYGLILEVFGGFLLLLHFSTDKIRFGKILLPIILVLLFVQDKRIVSRSLAYDLSFRINYYYNKSEYLSESKEINNNTINIPDSLIQDHHPMIYLNCATPSMTYYVLSNVNDLPVLNIEQRAYGDLVNNLNYSSTSKMRLGLNKGNKYSFVTIVGNEGLITNEKYCLDALKKNDYEVSETLEIDNFIGYKREKLIVLFGNIR